MVLTEVHRAGSRNSDVNSMVAQITQVGNAVGAAVTIGGSPYKYNGIAVANAAKPDKGDVVFVLCGNATNPQVTAACP